MGLFSKKKEQIPDLPQFPEFPKITSEGPAYRPAFPHPEPEDLHPAMMPAPDQSIQLPLKPNFPDEPLGNLPPMPPSMQQAQPMPPFIAPDMKEAMAGERPLFIKIDEYRDALGNIESLKKAVRDTEDLLEKVESIRLAEQEELKKCHENLEAIKEQLLFIDK